MRENNFPKLLIFYHFTTEDLLIANINRINYYRKTTEKTNAIILYYNIQTLLVH